MKRTITLLSLFLLPAQVHAQDVRMATEASFPPFSQTNADGSFSGFELDLGNEVCERAGWSCTWVKQDFDGAIAALLANQFDVIFSSMSIKPERAEVADFSIPYYVTATAFFGPEGTDGAVIEDLSGKTLGVYGGSIQESYATENFPGATVRGYDNIDLIGADLDAGRLDLMFVEQLAGLTWIAANPGHIQVGAEIPPAKFGDKGAGAMFRKEQPELRDAANAALKEIYADGTFDEIVAKWFPPGTSIRADGLWTE